MITIEKSQNKIYNKLYKKTYNSGKKVITNI